MEVRIYGFYAFPFNLPLAFPLITSYRRFNDDFRPPNVRGKIPTHEGYAGRV